MASFDKKTYVITAKKRDVKKNIKDTQLFKQVRNWG